MKKASIYTILSLIVVLMGCNNNNDINVFDKPASERAAEAIANLKADLIAPKNGWRLKYNPSSTAGSFYVLLTFKDDNTVNIKSDLDSKDGEFYDQTITYRIDNSLGLELIMESYCFFSFLFEQDEATFPAEFEFNYANKTPDGELVFKSKSDPTNAATTLLFEKAGVDDDSYLGQSVAENLTTLADDLSIFSSSMKLTYTNKDLIFYISLDPSKRTISIPLASRKTDTQKTAAVNFENAYILRGDSLVFNDALSGVFFNQSISIRGLKLSSLSTSSISVCIDPIPTHVYNGVTSMGDAVQLETTLVNASGATFAKNQFMSGSLNNIRNNHQLVTNEILADLPGAAGLQLYYNLPRSNGSKLNAIGFVIVNANNSVSYALWEFTPTLVDNNLIFNFNPDVSLYGDPTSVDISNVKKYIEPLTEGGKTFVLRYADGIFELYNPCTGWQAVVVSSQ